MPITKKIGRHHGHKRSATPESLPVADLKIPPLQQQQGTPPTKTSASPSLSASQSQSLSGSASKSEQGKAARALLRKNNQDGQHHHYHQYQASSTSSSFVQRFSTPLLMVAMTFIFCIALYYYNTSDSTLSPSSLHNYYQSIPQTPYRVFGPADTSNSNNNNHALDDFLMGPSQSRNHSSKKKLISYQEFTIKEQFTYLQQHGRQCHPDWSQRYAELQQQQQQQRGVGGRQNDDRGEKYYRLQVEIWKYCTLFLGHGNVYMESSNLHLFPPYKLMDFIGTEKNDNGNEDDDNGDNTNNSNEKNNDSSIIAIQIQTPAQQQQLQEQQEGVGNGGINMEELLRANTNTNGGSGSTNEKTVGLLHSSFLKVVDDNREVSLFLRSMIDALVETPLDVIYKDPLFVEKTLYKKLQQALSVPSSDKSNNKNNNNNKIQWTKWISQCQPLVDRSRQFLKENPAVTSSSSSSKSITNQAAVSPLSTKAANVRILEKTQMTLEERLHQLETNPHAPLYVSTPKPDSYGLVMSCPIPQGYCCQVLGHVSGSNSMQSIMALRHPVHGPSMTSSTTAVPSTTAILPPLERIGTGNDGNRIKSSYHDDENDLLFTASLQEIKMPIDESNKPSTWATPNFFDILLRNDCLPQSKACHKCLKSTKAGSCEVCKEACPCYCNVLCKVRPPPKMVSKKVYIQPPLYKKDPSRLIPRIVHQTWYEDVTPDKYPNMSRLIESWKRSGWEYNFYTDDMSADFLTKHFPPEVREAYESITPGAFKADLFRYCVLLIRGGVYADMDVLLESNLDEVITGDVGFMVPIDEPGIKVERRSCLWNGFLAVAPGHVFIAKTVEMVVNNIRNRFTSVDYDDMLCPNPALSVSHTVDTLFTCGPCILGSSVNHVLKRHYQNQFEIGTVDIFKSSSDDTYDGAVAPDDLRLKIPGRTVILQQNKQDMGAHRFTLLERDLIVAATDMPDYDDRPPSMEHYSKTHEKIGIYGLKKLYTDNNRANEELQFIVI